VVGLSSSTDADSQQRAKTLILAWENRLGNNGQMDLDFALSDRHCFCSNHTA